MKSLQLSAAGRLTVEEVPVPRVQKGEVLVEMKCSGVCGTDLEKVRGEAITPPILGHEVVGFVSKLGNGVKGLAVGDRVFAHHHSPCYRCELCARGEFTLCAEFPKHNIRPGGFAEFFAVPEWNVERGAVLKLPNSLSFEEASFIEPLGCCLRGLERANARSARSAVIYGAGPVGLTHLLLLRSFGCRTVVVSDLSSYRTGFARRLGAAGVYDPTDPEERTHAFGRLEGQGPDLAVVATGDPSAFDSAMNDVSKGGTVLLFGAPPSGSHMELDLAKYFLRGVKVVTSYSTSEDETREALRLLSRRILILSKLVTHRFSIDRAPEAFKVAQNKGCMKALVCS